MKIFLIVFPAIILILSVLIYNQMGKKEIMRMDLVQFIYAFIVTPMVIVWVKMAVFFNLNGSSGITDPEDKFVIDTAITIIALFVNAFMVMHSLTKTFAIKRKKDPLFDIFEHAEYFHLWLSHLVIYSAVLLLVLSLGILNSVLPFTLFNGTVYLYASIFAGAVFGYVFYFALWIYNVEKQRKFDKLMKLQIYVYTFILTSSYIIFRPKYSPEYLLYWMAAVFYLSLTGFSQILNRTRRKKGLLSG